MLIYGVIAIYLKYKFHSVCSHDTQKWSKPLCFPSNLDFSVSSMKISCFSKQFSSKLQHQTNKFSPRVYGMAAILLYCIYTEAFYNWKLLAILKNLSLHTVKKYLYYHQCIQNKSGIYVTMNVTFPHEILLALTHMVPGELVSLLSWQLPFWNHIPHDNFLFILPYRWKTIQIGKHSDGVQPYLFLLCTIKTTTTNQIIDVLPFLTFLSPQNWIKQFYYLNEFKILYV